MRPVHWPIARFGVQPETNKTALARDPELAGSAFVRFDGVDTRTVQGTWEEALPEDLAPEPLRRLSARRPDLCGLTLDRPRIMGIVNVTPDSFSDGGDRLGVDHALAAARQMVDAGADILDIGGESTRPGADTVPAAEEIARVVPVIEAIRASGVSAPISIDTRKSAVAEASLGAGASLVNDVSAMTFDQDMARLVAQKQVPICLMHALGDPKTMQQNPEYDDVVFDVFFYLEERIKVAQAAGIELKNIIVDPGIGFGKTLDHNMELLRRLAVYHDLGVPLLLGASRKRFIGTIGNAPLAKDRMPGSLALALHAAQQGAHIIRVHDVRETKQALALWQRVNEQRGSADG